MHGFIPALLWAVVIAISTWPLRVKVAKKTGLGDIGVASIMTSAVAILLFFPIIYALLLAASDLGALTNWIVEIQKTGLAVPAWAHQFPKVGEQIAAWWSTNLADPASLSIFLGNAEHAWIREFAQNIGTQAAHRLITLVFTIVTLFFLYKQGNDLSTKTLALLEKLTGESGKRYGLQAATAVRATVNGVVLVGLAEGLLIGLSYWIAGAPHAAILGLLTGALAMIPFAAPLIFTGVSVLLMAQGNMVGAISVFLFGLFVLSLGDHVFRPKIIGSSVELPFLWVLFGILGGVEVFGLIGLFIGPALMALVVMMWGDLTEPEKLV
jgi:predicted PurR-regulated permease PerM